MTTAAQTVYDDQFAWQLGENGHHSQKAIFNPSGSADELYGFFDDTASIGDKGSGHVGKKNAQRRFILVSEPPNFDVEVDPKNELKIEKTGKIYKVQQIYRDENGANVLWLV